MVLTCPQESQGNYGCCCPSLLLLKLSLGERPFGATNIYPRAWVWIPTKKLRDNWPYLVSYCLSSCSLGQINKYILSQQKTIFWFPKTQKPGSLESTVWDGMGANFRWHLKKETFLSSLQSSSKFWNNMCYTPLMPHYRCTKKLWALFPVQNQLNSAIPIITWCWFMCRI